MSDLQCAVTVVVVPDDQRPDAGRLRSEHPGAVLAGPGSRTAADRLARAVDALVRDLPGDVASAADLTRVLEALADEYRGECVVLAVAPTALADLVRLVLPGEATSAVVVEVDADGQRWARWPRDVSAARGR